MSTPDPLMDRKESNHDGHPDESRRRIPSEGGNRGIDGDDDGDGEVVPDESGRDQTRGVLLFIHRLLSVLAGLFSLHARFVQDLLDTCTGGFPL